MEIFVPAMSDKYHVEVFVRPKSYLKLEMCTKDTLDDKEKGLSSVNDGESGDSNKRKARW